MIGVGVGIGANRGISLPNDYLKEEDSENYIIEEDINDVLTQE